MHPFDVSNTAHISFLDNLFDDNTLLVKTKTFVPSVSLVVLRGHVCTIRYSSQLLWRPLLWGRERELSKKPKCLCLAVFHNASPPSVPVSICSKGGIHCSSAGEFTAELPKWQDGQKSAAAFCDDSLAAASSFMQRTIICVSGDTVSGPTLAHSWVKVVLLVKAGYLISPDGLNQWLPNVHS